MIIFKPQEPPTEENEAQEDMDIVMDEPKTTSTADLRIERNPAEEETPPPSNSTPPAGSLLESVIEARKQQWYTNLD